MKLLILKMTRQRALELGLLVCKCGHPENNHFDFGPCAHCKCKGLEEVGRSGVTIVKPKKRSRK